MTNRYTINGKDVEFTKINMIYDGIEVDGLLLHDCDGDFITSDLDYLPGDDDEAKTMIENCWWITNWHRDEATGYYVSDE